MKPEEIIKKFKEETGYTLVYREGKYSYGGSLNLGSTQITSLPEGLTVGGSLYLEGTAITSLPEGLTVGGSLNLGSTQITSLPEGLTVGGSLNLGSTQITSLPEGLTVGGSLYLGDTQITSLPEGLTVGGYLYLGDTQITSLPEGLTVGGSLYLEGTAITSLPEGLTVGGYLYLGSTAITDTSKVNRKFNVNMVDKLWGNSKYIQVDGMFAEKVNQHGNVWEVKKINGTKTFYIVTDGNGKYAHGDTIHEAKKDLIYKISNRDKSEYESLTLDSELTFEEAIECYRVITGACSFGTMDFVENYLSVKKEKYTIREMIELTEGRYGNVTFKEFFKP